MILDNLDNSTKQAFIWIVDLLSANYIPFYITGGFAAKHYGSNRKLYDIDIEVPEKYLDNIKILAQDYVLSGPKQYQDDNFDVMLLTINYLGQRIDISGYGNDKLYNHRTKKWEQNYSKDNTINVKIFVRKVSIITLNDLIVYKQKIGRPTDLKDLISLNKIKKGQ